VKVQNTSDIAAALDADTSIDAVYVTGLISKTADPISALKTLKTLRASNISFVLHDPSELSVKYLLAGQVDWVIGQQPFLQGYLPIVLLSLKINDEQHVLNPSILTGPLFFNATNILNQVKHKGKTW
jgi:simple sugar transport system substrate-binding protein